MSDNATHGTPFEDSGDLQRLKMLVQVQDELTAWAKRRFSILVVVIAVLGTFGVTTLLSNIIQTLVSGNVRASIEKEAGYINRVVQAQLDVLDNAIADYNRRFNDSIDQASAKTRDFNDTIRDIAEQGAAVRSLSDEVSTQLQDLKDGIGEAKSASDRIAEQSKALQDRYATYGKFVFNTINDGNDRVQLLRAAIEHETRVTALAQDAILAIGRSVGTADIRTVLDRFEADRTAIQASYDEFIEQFRSNLSYNVVVYIPREEEPLDANGVMPPIRADAEELTAALRARGFRAEVWRPSADTTIEALRADLMAEFGNIEPVLTEHGSALVAGPADRSRIAQIRQVMGAFPRFSQVADVERALQPDDMHRQPVGMRASRPKGVILLYYTGERS